MDNNGVDDRTTTDGRIQSQGDQGDGRGLFGFRAGPALYPQTFAGKDDSTYFMNHKNRGLALVLNHKNFDPSLQLQPRNGTDADAANLCRTFAMMGFIVDLKCDMTLKEVLNTMELLADFDHSDNDCLVVCLLSHGELGSVYAKDQIYKPDILWSMFTADKVRSLAGKPKIFFLQACQGDQLDSGVTLQQRTSADGMVSSYKIPSQADFLISYSTVPGYFSWRNTTNGSWFVQALCDVLKEYSDTKDLLSMMTIVCRKVALDYESNTPSSQRMHQKRQMPFITSMLTRDIFFKK